MHVFSSINTNPSTQSPFEKQRFGNDGQKLSKKRYSYDIIDILITDIIAKKYYSSK